MEKVPFDFKYEFDCAESGCRSHKLLCTDWEMGQSWRTRSNKYGTERESKFRQRYESEMMQKDTHFYVGTVHQYPTAWIIVGLFYPPSQVNEKDQEGIQAGENKSRPEKKHGNLIVGKGTALALIQFRGRFTYAVQK